MTMHITDDMVAAAKEAAPEIDDATIRKVLAAGTRGQVILMEGEGHKVDGGKSKWPVLAQIDIKSPQVALSLAQQLIKGASDTYAQKKEATNITLLIAGDAYCTAEGSDD